MPSYRIEQAKTSRAGCQNKECKDQKVKIQKGELRFGSWVDSERIQAFFWRHWGCVTPKIIGNVNEQIGEGDNQDIDLFDGYEELPSELQEKVLRALKNGHVDAEDWKGDPEMNQPGQTGFRVNRTAKKNAKKDANEEEKEDAASKEDKPKASKTKKKSKAADEQDEEGDEETPKSKTKKRTRLQVDDDANDAETYQPKRPRRKPTGYPKNVPAPSEDDGSDDDLSEPSDLSEASESPEPKKRGRKANAPKPAAKPAAKRGKKKADSDTEDAEAVPAAAKPKRGRKKAA
ncbi:hypothetical protein BDV18DRAFT_51707 [Aspergillus unguis]